MRVFKELEMFQDIAYLPIEYLKRIDPKLESFANVNFLEDIKSSNICPHDDYNVKASNAF